ncbi:hypothetical protein ACTXT7_008537 [Hymenolepis weldensis]
MKKHTMQVRGGFRHFCGRAFTERSYLEHYSLAHVGFRPYQCRVCLQGYYRQNHIMEHIGVYHPTVNPCENIQVLLTASQSLDYLNSTQSSVNNFPSTSSVIPKGLTANDEVEEQYLPCCAPSVRSRDRKRFGQKGWDASVLNS